MRILFVCHRFPFPPMRGGKIRPFNIIRHLSERHEVTVASLARSAEEAEAGAGLADYCSRFIMETVTAPMAITRMAVRLPTLAPSSMGYFYSPALARRAVRRATPSFYRMKISGKSWKRRFKHLQSGPGSENSRLFR